MKHFATALLTAALLLLPTTPALAQSNANNPLLEKCVQLLESKDETLAFRRCKEAADAGVGEAQFLVGTMYMSGRGVEVNEQEAYMWIYIASQKRVFGTKEILTALDTILDPEVIAAAKKAAEERQ